ncbi:uncharacterized protein LOC123519069 [Portunus trituberculatus]|uniref:uncharacterized protein LOC123519069 n=1 Tax=Portunus trituberculatus TaxID=210409 RepID=UPI001E1CD386|nr:uncharacterized protein LOC123519069 [Portunus trituberculatus]
MHIAIAGLVLSVAAGVTVGLTVLCFLFTRCCTKLRLQAKKRARKPPTKRPRIPDPEPSSSSSSDSYLSPISFQRPAILPALPLQKPPHKPQDVKKEDNTTFLEDNKYENSTFDYMPHVLAPNRSEDLPPSMYNVAKSQTSPICKPFQTPITVRTQGDKSSTLKFMPPEHSDMSYTCGEMPTINIYSTLSSLMPPTRKVGLLPLEAGEGTSTEDSGNNRITMTEMELGNDLRIKFKVKMDE